MHVSGNSRATRAYDDLVHYGGVIGAAIQGSLESIATGQQTVTNSSGISIVIRREQVMPYLQEEGWLTVLSSARQLYQLAPRLGGEEPEVLIVFSLHEEGRVWMHEVAFRDGAPITIERLMQLNTARTCAH